MNLLAQASAGYCIASLAISQGEVAHSHAAGIALLGLLIKGRIVPDGLPSQTPQHQIPQSLPADAYSSQVWRPMYGKMQGSAAQHVQANGAPAGEASKPKRQRPDRSGRKRKGDMANGQVASEGARSEGGSQPIQQPLKRQKRPAADRLTSRDAAVKVYSKFQPQEGRPASHAKQQMRPKPEKGISRQVQKLPVPITQCFFSVCICGAGGKVL